MTEEKTSDMNKRGSNGSGGREKFFDHIWLVHTGSDFGKEEKIWPSVQRGRELIFM